MHNLVVPDSSPQGNTGAQGVAHDVGLFDLEVFDQGGNVVRHQLEAERAVDVGGAPMGLQIDRLLGIAILRYHL